MTFSYIKKSVQRIEPKIAFKTGVAAALSFIAGAAFTKIIERPDIFISALWCVVASIVVMQAHLEGTYYAAWIRFLGVIIGSLIGSIFITYVGDGPISLGISVFLTVVLCSLLNISDSIRIAAMSTAIIVVTAGMKPEIDPWLFGFFRFIDSCIGIAIAIVVALSIWPEKAIENLRINIARTISSLSRFFRLAANLEPETDSQTESIETLFIEIHDLLNQNKKLCEEVKFELIGKEASIDNWRMISDQLGFIFEAIVLFRNVPKEVLSTMFDDSLSTHVKTLVDKTDQAFQKLEKIVLMEPPIRISNGLDESLEQLNADMVRFRETRAMRKYNLGDVENFYVFFYNLRAISEAVMKTEELLLS